MMSPELQILLWWTLFTATHVGGSMVAVRRECIARLGLMGFKALYSVVSLATFVPLVRVWWLSRASSAVLYEPGVVGFWVAHLLVLMGFFFMCQGYVTAHPQSSIAEITGHSGGLPRGVQRITRHPVNSGYLLISLGHLAANGGVIDVLFFVGFVPFCIVTAWHQDRRTAAMIPLAVREFQAQSSLLPFVAIARGRQKVVLKEFRLGAAWVSLAIFVALRMLHPVILGGFVQR